MKPTLDGIAERVGGALRTAVMRELRAGADPIQVLQVVAALTGACAQGVIDGQGAHPDAVAGIMDQAVTYGMHTKPGPQREAWA